MCSSGRSLARNTFVSLSLAIGLLAMSELWRGKLFGALQQFRITQSSPRLLNRCSQSEHRRCARTCLEVRTATLLVSKIGARSGPRAIVYRPAGIRWLSRSATFEDSHSRQVPTFVTALHVSDLKSIACSNVREARGISGHRLFPRRLKRV